MKLAIGLATLAAVVAAAGRGQLGFSLPAKRADGTCKTTADYVTDLATLAPYSKIVRTYSITDCEQTQQLMPAAQAAGVMVVLGVWPTKADHFEAEKKGLNNIKKFATSIHAITVGSEHLYRKDLTATQLAGYIRDVRAILAHQGISVPVGTADTWELWTQDGNEEVLEASDIVLANAFSYWQGQPPANATNSYFDDIFQALRKVEQVKAGHDFEFWVGESGWPTAGATYEHQAVPSVSVAAQYWKSAVCGLLSWGISTFSFEAWDEPYKTAAAYADQSSVLTEASWGVGYANRTFKYDLSC